MKILRRLLLVTAVLALSFYAHGETPRDAPFVAPVGQDGVQRVEMVGGSYWFRPNHIVVKQNTPVELIVSKESGLIPHDIAMHSPEAGMEFSESLSTTPKTVRFTPTKTGVYPFYCTRKSPFGKTHKERGMEGVVEVVP